MVRSTVQRIAAVSLWVIAVAVGFAWHMSYARTPGDAGAPPDTWPDSVAVERRAGVHTLLVALHPRCPCSRATIEALRCVDAAAGPSAEIIFLVSEPEGPSAEWAADRASLGLSEGFSGARVVVDRDGELSARFGLRTSGHVLAFDADGRRWFSGGVTPLRGERGPCVGRDRLIAGITSHPNAPAVADSDSPVFGCPLVSPDHCPLCRSARR